MSFALDSGLPPSRALETLARMQFAAALDALAAEPPDVHAARKTGKRLRALGQLLAPLLGEEQSAADRLLRDAGRALAAYRDADVALATLDALDAGALSSEWRAALRERLWRHAARQLPPGGLAAASRRAADLFTGARGYLCGPALAAVRHEDLAEGYRRGYARARAGWRAAAKKNADADDLHEWRKRVKAHAAQTALLAPLWPALARGRLDALEDLADALGDHHDLHALTRAATAAPGKPDEALRLLCQAAAARQHRLAERALAHGQALFGSRQAPAATAEAQAA